MRYWTMTAAAFALPLAGCGSEPSAEERAAAEQNVEREVVLTNDTTAIDAATGQAANMAADVDFMPDIDAEEGNAAGSNRSASSGSSSSRPAPRPSARPAARESTSESPAAADDAPSADED